MEARREIPGARPNRNQQTASPSIARRLTADPYTERHDDANNRS